MKSLDGLKDDEFNKKIVSKAFAQDVHEMARQDMPHCKKVPAEQILATSVSRSLIAQLQTSLQHFL